ncbi:MAG TPA: (2Fe-2S) ferredoxin domain-containing protein [Pyrinomonadaceae bacterium]|nr:(2Fe-2S) ferredoxin domain-containing protein [Pyrinomonadaceae bacterium]
MSGLKRIRNHILVCEHKDCVKRGGKDSLRELKGALKSLGLRDEVLISKVDCFDQCDEGPVVVVYPEGVWYGEVDERAAREIAERHVAEGRLARCNVLRDMRPRESKED